MITNIQKQSTRTRSLQPLRFMIRCMLNNYLMYQNTDVQGDNDLSEDEPVNDEEQVVDIMDID